MANERLGASFSIDVTNLKAGLTQANRMIRESESQFKAAAAGLDDWTKSEAGVTAKIRSLNEITDVQKKKVEALRTEYNNLIKNGMNPTSREAVELRTKINQEQAALASNEKELRKQTEALKNVGKEADETGDKVSKFGDIAKSAGAIAASAFAAAATAVGALLKSSIEGYAEYEQLVGGVDTLFKDASGKLQEYAANAYKTAGMSANEYMANVTGFSAALISSLGGDTEKAAETADRAMRDISDNANKMGTDASYLVETYQSLARGNYQMLDSLKLGYGGTKTELERLIADASKMTDIQKELNITVKEGDTSFGNIVNAISAVQMQMGITGTTAKEASTTIQGSIGSMSAAWSNLVTGMADETANIDLLITNFIDSVGSVAENLIPRLTVAADGLIKVIERLLPQVPPLLEQFLPILVEGAMNLLSSFVALFPTISDTILQLIPDLLSQLLAMTPEILSSIIQIVVQVANTLSAMLPGIVSQIMEILPLLINSLVSATPQLIQAAISLLMAIVQSIPIIETSLIENLPSIIDTIISCLVSSIPILIEGAITLFNAILDAIPVIQDALIENGPMIVDSIVDGLISASGALISGAIQLALGIGKGLIRAIPQIVSKIPQVISSMVNSLMSGVSKMGEVGADLIKGLWNGIKDTGKWLWDKISGFFGGIVDNIKGFFGIHSPSTLMENLVGKNLALGIGVGFEKNMAKVNRQIQNAIKIDDVGINARVSGSMQAENAGSGKTVVVYQTNNYSQAHSRFEIYKSKQQTLSAVQLALAGV